MDLRFVQDRKVGRKLFQEKRLLLSSMNSIGACSSACFFLGWASSTLMVRLSVAVVHQESFLQTFE